MPTASVIASLVRVAAAQRGEPMPGRSFIAAALRDAELTARGRWSRDDAVRFLAALFPDRSAGGGLRRGENGMVVSPRGEEPPDAFLFSGGVGCLSGPSSPSSQQRRPGRHCAAESPQAPPMYEHRAKVSYLVSIDSADRDATAFPTPSDFTVQFGRSDTTGLLRAFVDVSSVELVSVVVPKHTVDGDNVDDFPYLLLEIPEIGGAYQGTNMHTTRAFAKVRFADDLGAYREYRTTDAGERFVKQFDPVRSLDKLTIRFRRPDGTKYDFGTRVKRRARYATVRLHPDDSTGDGRASTVKMYFDGERWRPVHEPSLGAGSGSSGGGSSGGGSSGGGSSGGGSSGGGSSGGGSSGGGSGSEKTKKTAAPHPDDKVIDKYTSDLDDLPASNCYLVLRVTCIEMRFRTMHLHRQ